MDLANSGFLALGKLTARVEGKKAKGFTIDTPMASVEDLGTEFGVEVLGEWSYVHVYDGAVELAPSAAGAELVKLVAGEGTVISRHGILRDVAGPSPNAFRRGGVTALSTFDPNATFTVSMIEGDEGIVNVGETVLAENVSGGDVTVNGVKFKGVSPETSVADWESYSRGNVPVNVGGKSFRRLIEPMVFLSSNLHNNVLTEIDSCIQYALDVPNGVYVVQVLSYAKNLGDPRLGLLEERGNPKELGLRVETDVSDTKAEVMPHGGGQIGSLVWKGEVSDGVLNIEILSWDWPHVSAIHVRRLSEAMGTSEVR